MPKQSTKNANFYLGQMTRGGNTLGLPEYKSIFFFFRESKVRDLSEAERVEKESRADHVVSRMMEA